MRWEGTHEDEAAGNVVEPSSRLTEGWTEDCTVTRMDMCQTSKTLAPPTAGGASTCRVSVLIDGTTPLKVLLLVLVVLSPGCCWACGERMAGGRGGRIGRLMAA